jgi:hypothetical protein
MDPEVNAILITPHAMRNCGHYAAASSLGDDPVPPRQAHRQGAAPEFRLQESPFARGKTANSQEMHCSLPQGVWKCRLLPEVSKEQVPCRTPGESSWYFRPVKLVNAEV